MSETVTLNPGELEALVRRALVASNTSKDNAMCVARALVAAECAGQKGHGISRVASYSAQARSGKVDGQATPAMTTVKTATVHIDANHGFAYPAIDLAIDTLPALAREHGLGAAGISHSHHSGQAGYHVERLAQQGVIAMMFGNSPRAIAPWGSTTPVYGTNPLAFAAPRKDAAPLVVDLSLTKVARGKIMVAAKNDEAIPEGWALGPDGQPTTDPHLALKGTMLPIGDAKGAALAMVFEILAVALTGAKFGYEASSFFEAEGDRPGVGQLLIAFACDGIRDEGVFADRLEALLNLVCAQEGVRLPGTRSQALKRGALKDGVTVSRNILADVEKIASSP